MAEIITTLTVIFVAAAATLFIAKKFNHPAVPAYIVAGVLSILTAEVSTQIAFIPEIVISESELIGLAELGIAFLIFIFGIRFDPERLRSVAKESQVTTIVQIIFIGSSGFWLATVFGLDTLNSVYFALAASLSSSLIGLELMEKEVEKNLIHGRLTESINLLQDSIGVVAIIILGASAYTYSDVGIALMNGIGVIALGLIIREFFFDQFAKHAEGSTELLMLSSLSLLTGFIYLSETLGLSMIVGAFAAGLSVAKFPHNMEIIDTMGSIKDFFAAIFFVVLGALISVPSPAVISLALLLILVTAVIKPLLVVITLIDQGYDSRTAYLTGFGLDQISEYVLVIAIQAYIAGAIMDGLFEALVIASVVTIITSSYTSRYQHEAFNLLSRYDIFNTTSQEMEPEHSIESDIEDHVILLGYDIQGKRIAEALKEEDIDFIVIDNDPESIIDARKNEEEFIYGNIMNYETWEKAKPEKAKLIVSTIPFRKVSERIIQINTDADIILRSGDLEEAHNLLEKGVTYVAVPDILSAELLEDHIRGVLNDVNYREELRRRNLLEIRRYIEAEEG